MPFAGLRLEAKAFFGGVVFVIDIEDVIIAIFPEVEDHIKHPLDDVCGP